MRHEWEDASSIRRGLARIRRCRLCRAEQVWNERHWYMRADGGRWYPPVGRCRGEAAVLRWKKATFGHQETHCGRYYVHQEPAYSESCRRWHANRIDLDEALTTEGFRDRESAKEYCQQDVFTEEARRAEKEDRPQVCPRHHPDPDPPHPFGQGQD